MNIFRKAAPTLCLAFLLSVLTASAAVAQDATYEGEKTCKVCHNKSTEGEQWNKWNADKHSKALETLKSDASIALAKEKGLAGPPSEAPECLKCHVTGYDAAAKAAPAKITATLGVQCESCHGASNAHVASAKEYKMKKITLEQLQASRELPEEKVCLTCHNEESPTWNPERYTADDGAKSGFNFKQAAEKIAHPNPLKKKDGAAK
ncbi:MAG: hypothetical protein HYV27_23575 [Candidatus Hydrogenedentes bacterium]|nr:hypothetical protein [Candidatus Hydrogenedentota bacterium]